MDSSFDIVCEIIWKRVVEDGKFTRSVEADRTSEKYFQGYGNTFETWTMTKGDTIIQATRIDSLTFTSNFSVIRNERMLVISQGARTVFRAKKEDVGQTLSNVTVAVIPEKSWEWEA